MKLEDNRVNVYKPSKSCEYRLRSGLKGKNMANQLAQLRKMTDVVADTGDIEAIARYRPVDATTNPSLLLQAASLPSYAGLIRDLARRCDDVADFTDRFAVGVGCEVLKLIPGRISTEVDARLSFDIDGSVAKAKRLVDLYSDAGVGRDRILIKLASTWEGIQAAAILEKDEIRCNLTLLFCDVQAVAAAKTNTYLISPFVGRILDWYKKTEKRDRYEPHEDPGVRSVQNIYRLFKSKGFETVVMGASFRNADEIRSLAGCDRLTINPNLLDELERDTGELEPALSPNDGQEFIDCDFDGEADFRFQLNANPMATEQLAAGIRGFVSDQVKLENLLNQVRIAQVA